MTIEEVAKNLKIPKSSIYKLAQEDEIPSQKGAVIGDSIRLRLINGYATNLQITI